MQHQAQKYAPSLVNDGQFTQGLSHWFGSFVTHHVGNYGSQARIDAKYASDYSVGMPFGISQFIDVPEMHSYPAAREAQTLRMLPLGAKLALLVTSASTTLQGRPLTAGVEGAAEPFNTFQHPFRFQDSEGALNIVPTSSISLDGYAAYAGEYRAGAMIIEQAATPQEIVHHRLYVSPEKTIPALVSSTGFGGVRVQTDPTNLRLMFLGDPTELVAVLDQVNVTGVAQLTAVLNEEWQVQLVSVSGITTLSPGVDAFTVSYSTILGGSAPEAVAEYTGWALYRQADVDVKYTMPLYGYEYTLSYTYQGRRPRPAELTFRSASSSADGFTINGFGEIALAVASDSTLRRVVSAENNLTRNLEVLRGESRTKVIGRPMLTIPTLNASELLETARSITRIRRPLIGDVEVYTSATEQDTAAFPVFNMRWVDGSAGQPGHLYLGGVLQPGNWQPGQSLGAVSFTGHIAGLTPNGIDANSVTGLVASILYFQPDPVTAEMYLSDGTTGEEVFVTFSIGGVAVETAADVVTGSVPDGASYTLDPADSLGLRGEHWGTSTDPQYPRIQPGSAMVFESAPPEVDFLNDGEFAVAETYMNTLGQVVVVLANVDPAQFAQNSEVASAALQATRMSVADSASQPLITDLGNVGMWLGNLTNPLNSGDATDPQSLEQGSRDALERHTDPLSSLFPKGMVMLYAGGGTCPAGFKPVQGTAEVAGPGIPGTATMPPVIAVNYDAVSDMTRLDFPTGAIPLLRDTLGSVVSIGQPITESIAAPSLEYSAGTANRREVAKDSQGNQVNLAQLVRRFRQAIEPGMILRVEESTAPDAAAIGDEDRGFLVVDTGTQSLPDQQTLDSSFITDAISPEGGQANSSTIRDLANSTDRQEQAMYKYGKGYGKISYPAADIAEQGPYGFAGEGWNRPTDQQLTNDRNIELGLRPNDYLLPLHPTRFAQTPQQSPAGPNIWGQRERFHFDAVTDTEPSTLVDPNHTNRKQVAYMYWFDRWDFTGGGNLNFDVSDDPAGFSNQLESVLTLPNPAWDLMSGDIDPIAYPPIEVSTNNNLGAGVSGYMNLPRLATFFCRVYAKCDSIVDGRPVGNIRGLRPTENAGSASSSAEEEGVTFLHSTAIITVTAISGSNKDFRLYEQYAGPASLWFANSDSETHPSQWSKDMLLVMTPVCLYGQPQQPQDFGAVPYSQEDGTVSTFDGPRPGGQFTQTQFAYVRGAAAVNAIATLAPRESADSLLVAGDLSSLDTQEPPRLFAEPSGYLKYGSVGGLVDYGPGAHQHQVSRNDTLLGSSNLAEPLVAEIHLLPATHGHGTAGSAQTPLPAANLFTSCIKL